MIEYMKTYRNNKKQWICELCSCPSCAPAPQVRNQAAGAPCKRSRLAASPCLLKRKARHPTADAEIQKEVIQEQHQRFKAKLCT